MDVRKHSIATLLAKEPDNWSDLSLEEIAEVIGAKKKESVRIAIYRLRKRGIEVKYRKLVNRK